MNRVEARHAARGRAFRAGDAYAIELSELAATLAEASAVARRTGRLEMAAALKVAERQCNREAERIVGRAS